MEKVTLTFSHLLSHLGEASLRAHYVLQQLASVFHTSQISSTGCFSQGQKCQKPREEDTMNEWVAAGVALILTFTAQWTKLPDYLWGLKRRGQNVPQANHWTNAIVNSWGNQKRDRNAFVETLMADFSVSAAVRKPWLIVSACVQIRCLVGRLYELADGREASIRK